MTESLFFYIVIFLCLLAVPVISFLSTFIKRKPSDLQVVTDKEPLLKEVAPGLSVVVEQEPELKDVEK